MQTSSPTTDQLVVHSTMQDIPIEQWRQIVPEYFPFAKHEFFSALERSGCVGGESGWQPLYLTVKSLGKLSGATVIYLKTNSYGEYIFDWDWASAYHAQGLAYYPKLTAAIPFTPATGHKFYIASDANKNEVQKLLLGKV